MSAVWQRADLAKEFEPIYGWHSACFDPPNDRKTRRAEVASPGFIRDFLIYVNGRCLLASLPWL